MNDLEKISVFELMQEVLNNPESTQAEMDEALEQGRDAIIELSRRETQPQVDALIDAGWRFELPDMEDPEPFQWFWRRPPRTKHRKGKLFASTQQAFNALTK